MKQTEYSSLKELCDKLKETYGLHAFVELFGFNWETDVWTWHDVAVKMANDIEMLSKKGT